MKGRIKAYSKDVNAGLIIADNGSSYIFPKKEWNGQKSPEVNKRVEFDQAADHARNVVES